MTTIESLNKLINPLGMICGRRWDSGYAICGTWKKLQVEFGNIKGVHVNLGNFDTLAEMEEYIANKFKPTALC